MNESLVEFLGLLCHLSNIDLLVVILLEMDYFGIGPSKSD